MLLSCSKFYVIIMLLLTVRNWRYGSQLACCRMFLLENLLKLVICLKVQFRIY